MYELLRIRLLNCKKKKILGFKQFTAAKSVNKFFFGVQYTIQNLYFIKSIIFIVKELLS